MQVRITNVSEIQQTIDLNGDANPDTTIILGSKNTTEVDIVSERRFVQLSKEFKNKLIIRKL